MKLYAFDAIDEQLALLPLAARRALDHAGLKLSRKGFSSLPHGGRVALVEAGSGLTVDVPKVKRLTKKASPAPAPMTPERDPNPASVPPNLEATYQALGPISLKVWQTLSPLDRYALVKVASKKKPERIVGAYQEIIGQSAISTHLAPQGGVRMVNMAQKPGTHRRAVAESWVTLSPDAYALLHSKNSPKGDVLGTARLAGIMATKRTSDLIPLCHPLSLSHAEVTFIEHPKSRRICIRSAVEIFGPTGVEMEALVGASVAALTLYDMLKSVDRAMSIGPTQLVEKSGGNSGAFVRAESSEAAESPESTEPADRQRK